MQFEDLNYSCLILNCWFFGYLYFNLLNFLYHFSLSKIPFNLYYFASNFTYINYHCYNYFSCFDWHNYLYFNLYYFGFFLMEILTSFQLILFLTIIIYSFPLLICSIFLIHSKFDLMALNSFDIITVNFSIFNYNLLLCHYFLN